MKVVGKEWNATPIIACDCGAEEPVEDAIHHDFYDEQMGECIEEKYRLGKWYSELEMENRILKKRYRILEKKYQDISNGRLQHGI